MASRSIEEIYTSLVESIASQSGSSWSALKDSMVGKELLYAGANIISATEFVSESVNGVLDVSRYGIDQLVAYAYTQDVPLDLGRPSSIKVRFKGSYASTRKVFAPFSLKVEIGTLSFYNIDYCSSDGEVSLYCGSVCRMQSSATSLSLPFGVSATVTSPWRLFLELKKGTYQSSYVKLGQDVLSDSVWVFAQPKVGTSPVFPYTTYNAAITDPDAKLYKVRTLWDYSTCVLFGDGNWAQPVLPAQYNYEIVWLRGGYGRFTVMRGVTMSYTDLSGRVSTLTQENDFEVLSTQDGELQSLSYARNYVVSQIFKDRGLVTEVQLRNFLLSFPSIQSVYLDTEGGLVDIHVKPMVQTDTAFQFIEDYLYQYGVSGLAYSCKAATPIRFTVRLRATDMSGQQALLRAMSTVEDLYSFDSVTMDTRVSSALIQQELTLQGISGVIATLYGMQDVDGRNDIITLQALPASGSVRQFSSDGLLVGFDSEGRYKTYTSISTVSGLLESAQATSTQVSTVGDFYWLSGGTSDVPFSYLVSLSGDGRLLLTDSSGAFIQPSRLELGLDDGAEQPKMQFAPYGNGVLCMYCEADYAGTQWETFAFRLYRDSSIFEEGDYSIFDHPTFVSPIKPLGSSNSLFYLMPYIKDGGEKEHPAGSIQVLRIMGATGTATSADTVTCAVKYNLSDDDPTKYICGLATYRLASGSTYGFDLMLMYGPSSMSLVQCSSYYGGRWYMPLSTNGLDQTDELSMSGKSMKGVGVYEDRGSYGYHGLDVLPTDVMSMSNYTKVYALDAIDGNSNELKDSELLDFRIVDSTTAWVLYKRDANSSTSSSVLARMSYTLLSGNSGASRFRYSLQDIYTFPSVSGANSRIEAVPQRINVSSSGFVSVVGVMESARTFWVLPTTEGSKEMVRYAMPSAQVVRTTGSVDYGTGEIQGVAPYVGYIEYEISSTLGNGSEYPLLADVRVE